MKYSVIVCSVLVLFTSCAGSTPANENTSSGNTFSETLNQENANSSPLSLEGSALEERKKLEAEMAQAKTLLSEAQSLDITKQQEDIKARLGLVKEKATMLREVDDFFVDADMLLQEIQTLEDRMENYIQVAEVPLLTDLSGKFPETQIKSLMKQGNQIFVIADKGVIGPINGRIEEANALSFPAGSIGISGAYSLKYKESYLATIPGQMWKMKNGLLSAQSVEEGGAWYPGSELWAYGKFLYVLDPLSKQLWKYEYASDNVFKKAVVAIDTPEMKALDIKSVSIDGNIYVLSRDGSIHKFTQGKKIDMEIDVDLKGLSGESMMYTDQNSAFLYVFDSAAGRLIKFRKRTAGLSVESEYTIKGTYNGMIITPDEKAVLLFDNTKIYRLGL